MSKQKKPYMVAVTRKITIEATMYFETLASNGEEAEEIAKRELAVKDIAKSLSLDAKQCLDDGDYEKSLIKFTSVGRSNQYHSSNECKICKKYEEGT